jgi:hypothetical protein
MSTSPAWLDDAKKVMGVARSKTMRCRKGCVFNMLIARNKNIEEKNGPQTPLEKNDKEPTSS